jgi:hypothetical protein
LDRAKLVVCEGNGQINATGGAVGDPAGDTTDLVVQLIDVALDNNAIGGAVINLFGGAEAIGDPRRATPQILAVLFVDIVLGLLLRRIVEIPWRDSILLGTDFWGMALT